MRRRGDRWGEERRERRWVCEEMGRWGRREGRGGG